MHSIQRPNPPARLQVMPRFHSRRERVAASVPPQEQLLRSTSFGDQGNPIPLTSCRQAKASCTPMCAVTEHGQATAAGAVTLKAGTFSLAGSRNVITPLQVAMAWRTVSTWPILDTRRSPPSSPENTYHRLPRMHAGSLSRDRQPEGSASARDGRTGIQPGGKLQGRLL